MSQPLLLGVNIDHVATLRQARGTRYPDVLQAARVAELAGADLITVHLREDRRHIQDRDVELLKELLQVRLNLEMAVTGEMIDLATRLRPADVCLVPEKRQELTTEGGLDVAGNLEQISAACARLGQAGIRVSLFIDPETRQLEAARQAGAPVVELHTGNYADADSDGLRKRELVRIREAAVAGGNLDLVVNAGHGLHYHNVQDVAAIAGIRELNIGHAIIARSVFTGLHAAIREMRREMDQGRSRSD